MYGRKIGVGLRADTPLHLYLPGPKRGVWNEEALIASKEIILCEALIDALTFWCAGYRQVTTSYGVNGCTDEIKTAFQRHGPKRILIAYDNDDAGNKAAQKHAEELMAMGIECLRVKFPKGMDANEYGRTVQPIAKSLGMLLNRAEWLGKGKPPILQAKEWQPMETAPDAGSIEEEINPAAKEENAIAEPTAPAMTEPVLSLAAESPKPEATTEQPNAAEPSKPAPSALAPKVDIPVEIVGTAIWMTQGERRYRVLGLEKNTTTGVLRVNVMVTATNARHESRLHVDTLDIYAARQRTIFTKLAAAELGIKEEIITRDLGRVLLKLEEMQREQMDKALKPKEEKIEMTAEEEAAALELLRDPNLLDRINGDFEQCGVIRETTNKMVGYLSAVSRLLESPLAVVVQSTSAAGKSALMEAVLAFLPPEHRVQYSAMTGQALFYMGEKDLKHRVLAMVEEEGAQRAAYALKLLQSEGVLTIASTGKDANTGRLITQQYRVEGPVMIFTTTTAIDVDEELLNRCLVLTVNEDPEQTQAIHQKQREAQTLAGLWARQERAAILKVHQNAQRLLKPIPVVNEHAPALTFPYSMTRTRRDHMKLLTLIQAITLLHQHQREIKTATRNGKTVEFIEATKEDNELAWKLASELLAPSLDELPPQTRKLLLLLHEMVSKACEEQQIERSELRFSRRDVRHSTRWGDSQLKKHLKRLEEMEYLLVHRGGRGQSFVYELYFDLDENGKPVLPRLGYGYDAKKSRSNGQLSPSSHAQVTGVSRGGHAEESRATTGGNGDFSENGETSTTREHEKETGQKGVVAVGKANGHHVLAKRAGVK
jgi:hypothetical protein